MSSKIKGLRRVGIVGLSTVVAASMMTLSAVSASAVANDYKLVGTAPNVTQGANNQAAAGVTLDFGNSFGAAATQTFAIARGATANSCSTAGGVAAAVDFTSAPTATLTGPFNAAGTAAGDVTSVKPAFTVALTGSTAQCTSNGVLDTFTVTMTGASAGFVTTDFFKLTLSGINYNVGATAVAGGVNLISSGALATPAGTQVGTLVNANVTVGSYTVIPLIAAQLSSSGNVLGTASMVETTAGAFFGAGVTTVTLTLSAGAFTAGVTPVITLPAGYKASTVGSPLVAPPATTLVTTYAFDVNAPATVVKATVSIAGLQLTAPGTAQVVTLTTSAMAGAMDAANVLDFAARTGGATRYETAAALFSGTFGPAGVTESPDLKDVTTVVLSGGALFPDALSANYLAGKLGTGTLLTKPAVLSTAARTAIFNAKVSTVYITGLTGAVSQGVENTIEAMHIGNDPAKAFITTVRLGGATRYETNMLVNEFNFTTSSTVLLAAGTDFADALAMGPVAYKGTTTGSLTDGYPLIITRGVTLGAGELAQLSDFNPTYVVIAGGTGVVSAAIETSLKAKGYTVLRLAGKDRTQTAAAIATWATVGEGVSPFSTIRTSRGFLSNRTFITTGTGFADALAAGPVAGLNNQLIVLSLSPTALGAGIPAYLGTKAVGTAADGVTVGVLHALGLTGATSNGLMRAAAATIGQ